MFVTKFRVVISLFTVLFLSTTLLHAGQAKFTKNKKLLLFSQDGGLVHKLALPYKPSVQAASEDLKVVYAADLSGKNLMIYDSLSGAILREIAVNGTAVALAEDALRQKMYVLSRNPNAIAVLDTRTHSWVGSINLADTPLSFALDSRAESLYVGFEKPLISRISTIDGRVLSSITDVDASVKAISSDSATDRLVALHEKHVAVYRLSNETFFDYVKLEGEPAAVRVDSASGNLYLQLRDEPDMIATYSLANLELTGRKNMRDRRHQGRRVDASSFFVNSRTGKLSFVDSESETTFAVEDTTFLGPLAPAVTPPGYTASADIPVNQFKDNGTQLVPAVEFDSVGNILFAWMDDAGNDGNGEGAFARRFTPAITPMENDFSAVGSPSGDQGSPSIAGGADQMVVVWRDGLGKDGDSFGVFGRLFNSHTAPPTALGGDFLIPNTTSGRQMMPWVDMKTNGDFIAAWSGRWNAAGGARQTFTRRFNGAGVPYGNEVLANTTVKGNTWAVQVDVSPNGRFGTVWRDDADNGIRGRVYDAAGNPVTGSTFKAGPIVNGNTSTFAPSIAIKDDGSFIVVFKENQAGGIVGQKFDANQNSLGTFVVTSKKTKANDAPIIGMAPDGRFVVVWRDSGYANMETVARVFNADGTPNGDDFVVPENPADDEFEPQIAMDAAGNFAAVWKDRNRTPSIYGRYFSTGTLPANITVTGVVAGNGDRGTTDDYVVQGTGFEAGATVDFNDPAVIVNSYGTITETTIEVNVTIQAAAFLGFHDVEVTVDGLSGSGEDLFEVQAAGAYPAPTVTNVVLPTGLQNTTMDVLINGLDFANHPSTVTSFGADITVNDITVLSPIQISANISIGGSAATGLRNVTVSNPGPSTGTCTNCFDVVFNPVLFADNFGDGNFNGWSPQGGSWSAATNALVGSDSGKATITATTFGGCSICSVEAKIRTGTGDNSKVSLIAWYLNAQNYVELIMDRTKDKWTIKNRVNGTVFSKGKYNDTIDLVVNTLYSVKLEYDGANISLFVHGGGSAVATAPATGISGTVGFRVNGTSGTIDDVLVNP